MRGMLRVWLAMLAVLSIAEGARAQIQSGNIYGSAVDPEGKALPGATVSARGGKGAVRTTTTAANGEFRFLNLDPASYEVTVEMQGFSTAKRTGVVVNVGANVDLKVQLTLAGVTAETTVSATAAVLETKKTGTSTSVPQAELQAIPSARDPWAVLNSVPGVLTDRVNVGGSESGQQSVFVGKGDNGDNAMWNIDGVTITDMAAAGSSPTYYDFDSFEEVQITTGGSDPRLQTGGIGINLVTKRGGNDLHATGRVFYTDAELQGDNVPDDLAAVGPCRGVDGQLNQPCFPGNRIDKIQELGGDVGGPILKDKLWFWGAYAENDIRQLAITGAPDNTTLKDSSVKLSAQLSSDNQATGFWYRGDKIKIGRNASTTRPPETTWDQAGPTNIYKLEDFHTVGSDFYLNTRYAWVNGGFGFEPQGGRDIQVGRDGTGVWRRSYLYYNTSRPQDQVSIDGNLFRNWGSGTHEFKFGFTWRRTPVDSVSGWPADKVVADEQFDLAWITRDRVISSNQSSTGFYVGDTMTRDRLTLNLGLRYDHQAGNNAPSSSEANPMFPELLPALEYEGSPKTFDWDNLSPRIGATYALGDSRKTLVRASYAMYADQLTSGRVTFDSPLAGISELDYVWNDDGDRVVQPEEVDLTIPPYAYYVDPDNPTSATAVDRIDPALSAPRTHEVLLGAEHELAANFSVGFNYTWRRLENKIWTPLMKADGSIVTAADYELASTVTDGNIDFNQNPATSNTEIWYRDNGGPAFSEPMYRLKQGVELAPGPGRLQTNREGYHQGFNGLELTMNKRLSNRWMARASFGWNSWKEYFDGEQAIMDPTRTLDGRYTDGYGAANIDGGRVIVASGGSGSKGDVILNGDWQFNINGMYEVGWGINLAANLFGRQGFLAPQYIQWQDPDGIQSGGKALLIAEPDYERMDDVFSLDLRAEKTLKVDRFSMVFDIDLFNVFNTNTALQKQRRGNVSVPTLDETSRLTINAYDRTREIVAPRLFRFGARLNF